MRRRLRRTRAPAATPRPAAPTTSSRPKNRSASLTREGREAWVGATGRIGWCRDALGDHGNDFVAPFDAAELVRAERKELHTRRRCDADDGCGRCREQDLPGACEIAYPRRVIHRRAADVVVDGDELARGHADPDVQTIRADRERALQCDRGTDRVHRIGERRDRGVALGRCSASPATVFLDAAVDRELHVSEESGHTLRCALPQLGRSNDIGEHHGADTGRRLVVPTGAQALDQDTRRCGTAGRIDRQGRAERRLESCATSLGTPFHIGTPPVGGSPVRSANAVAPKL